MKKMYFKNFKVLILDYKRGFDLKMIHFQQFN